MGRADYFKHGTNNALCAVCGFKFKRDELKLRWDNCWVCPKDWEPRHPRDDRRITPRKIKAPDYTLNDNEESSSQVIGSDTNNYTCTKQHTADSDNKPITGARYAEFWEQAGTSGVTWVDGTEYKKV